MMKLNSTRNPEAKAISKGVAGTTCFIQFTSKTGAVCKFEVTAKVAPVSLTLRVKTMMAPESMRVLRQRKHDGSEYAKRLCAQGSCGFFHVGAYAFQRLKTWNGQSTDK